MPQAQQPQDDLTSEIRCRISPADKARSREDARLAGMSHSEYMRRRLLGKPVLAKVDQATIRELRRLGGLLKHVNNQSSGAYTPAVVEALGHIEEFIEQLSRDC